MRKESKAKAREAMPGMRSDYDFSSGVRGKHATRYADGTNLVLLDPDVAELFPTTEAVNQALRALAQVARRQLKKRPGASSLRLPSEEAAP